MGGLRRGEYGGGGLTSRTGVDVRVVRGEGYGAFYRWLKNASASRW